VYRSIINLRAEDTQLVRLTAEFQPGQRCVLMQASKDGIRVNAVVM